MKSAGRRDFLKQAGLMGSVAMMAGLPQGSMALGGERGRVIEDAVLPAGLEELPKNHIKFAVCGVSHDHIYGMVGAIQRGGGELVAAWGGEEDKRSAFSRRFPDVKMVKTQDEILNDPAVQLVLCSQIANERAGLECGPCRRARTSSPTSPASPRWSNWRGAKDHRRDEAHLRHHVYRTAGGEGRGLCRRVDQAGRHRQGDSDHQHCAASGDPAHWR